MKRYTLGNSETIRNDSVVRMGPRIDKGEDFSISP